MLRYWSCERRNNPTSSQISAPSKLHIVLSKFEDFLHHGSPSLYRVVFLVCLIMSTCSSVITEYLEANFIAFWSSSFDMDG